MSSDKRLHALRGVRLVCNHHHPVSVHVKGAQVALSVANQAEHGFVKVLVLLLYVRTHTHTHTHTQTHTQTPPGLQITAGITFLILNHDDNLCDNQCQ